MPFALLHQNDGFKPIDIVEVLPEKGVAVTGFFISDRGFQAIIDHETSLAQRRSRGGIFINSYL